MKLGENLTKINKKKCDLESDINYNNNAIALGSDSREW